MGHRSLFFGQQFGDWKLVRFRTPGNFQQILTNAQPIQLFPGEGYCRLPFGKISDANSIGMREERTSHAGRVCKAIGGFFAEHMSDCHQELAGDRHDGLGTAQVRFQPFKLLLPVGMVLDRMVGSIDHGAA